MLPSENLQCWRLLEQIDEAGGLTQGAIALDMDLGQASRLIKALEEELKVSLLDRRKRPVGLTAEARNLLPPARKFLNSYTQLMAQRHYFELKPVHIRVGIPVNIPREATEIFLSAFVGNNAWLSFDILAEATKDELLMGRCDFAFLPYPAQDSDLEDIFWAKRSPADLQRLLFSAPMESLIPLRT